MKLSKPTVREVINALSAFNLDAPFRIEDADTLWTISEITIYTDTSGIVWFEAANYLEMTRR